jgi:integrase
MTLDLFDSPTPSPLQRFTEAFDTWAADQTARRGLGRDTSVETYRVMWTSLIKWALGQTPALDLADLTAADLELFLSKRGRHDATARELSPRYVWRMLKLIDRVLLHEALRNGSQANTAAKELLSTHQDWRYANASDKDPLPDYLTAAQAKDLVNYLSVGLPRQGRRSADLTWQELRNRAMVALHLGAGATPAAVRSLQLSSVITQGGPREGLPWKLVIAASGTASRHESPLAVWAAHVLRHWVAARQEAGIPGTALFPSTRTGKPIGKVAHYLAVCQTLDASGLDKSLVAGGAFRLRHTFALRQLRRGHAEAEVARWLGVEPAEMMRYRRVVFAPVAEVV